MYTVYLGLGSNVGNRLEFLSAAVYEIGLISQLQSVSSVYETQAVGVEAGDDFYNMAVAIHTPDDAPLLLVKLKAIEKRLGRKRHGHGLPRTIDIDILMYRGFAYEDHTVQVPHRALEHRRFALEPLHEIAPTAVHPVLEKTVATLLRQCHDRHRVTRTDHQVHIVSIP